MYIPWRVVRRVGARLFINFSWCVSAFVLTATVLFWINGGKNDFPKVAGLCFFAHVFAIVLNGVSVFLVPHAQRMYLPVGVWTCVNMMMIFFLFSFL